MTKGTCKIDGCTSKNRSRGLCGMHYQRLLARGTTDDPKPPPVEDRFWARVDKSGPSVPGHPEMGECWQWTGKYVQHKTGG